VVRGKGRGKGRRVGEVVGDQRREVEGEWDGSEGGDVTKAMNWDGSEGSDGSADERVQGGSTRRGTRRGGGGRLNRAGGAKGANGEGSERVRAKGWGRGTMDAEDGGRHAQHVPMPQGPWTAHLRPTFGYVINGRVSEL
jgi:hypothetical protein